MAITEIDIQIERLPGAHDIPIPTYATIGAVGMDLCAAVSDEIVLRPGERKLIPTGYKFAIPPGFEGQVRARSGSALKKGLGIPNSPGTIDSDYRGELGVIMINWGDEPQRILRGDRIAQLVIAPVIRAKLTVSNCLDKTIRGDGGFGHSGT